MPFTTDCANRGASLKTLKSGREIIVPNTQEAALTLKAPIHVWGVPLILDRLNHRDLAVHKYDVKSIPNAIKP